MTAKPRTPADRLARARKRIKDASDAMLAELRSATKNAKLAEINGGLNYTYDSYWHGAKTAYEQACRALGIDLFEIEQAHRKGQQDGIDEFRAKQADSNRDAARQSHVAHPEPSET